MSFQYSRLVHCAKVLVSMKRIGIILLFASASSYVAAESTTHTVVIESMKFSPSTLEIKLGDAVVWQNKDFFPHDVTAENNSFQSKTIPSQGSWKFVAKKRGQFSYLCSLHPMMKAVLVVK